jgi:hypothetical protein
MRHHSYVIKFGVTRGPPYIRGSNPSLSGPTVVLDAFCSTRQSTAGVVAGECAASSVTHLRQAPRGYGC